jgi:hypothetical protein
MNKLPAGHIGLAEIKEHAELYKCGQIAERTEDVLWILRNGGPQSAENLLALGYLLAQFQAEGK